MNLPHTITVYHRTESGGTVKWERKTISGALWEDLQGMTLRKTGVMAEDKAQIYIPIASGATVSEKDIIVKGVCEKEIEKSSREIPEGLYITAVETFDYGNLQHWRVTAK